MTLVIQRSIERATIQVNIPHDLISQTARQVNFCATAPWPDFGVALPFRYPWPTNLRSITAQQP